MSTASLLCRTSCWKRASLRFSCSSSDCTRASSAKATWVPRMAKPSSISSGTRPMAGRRQPGRGADATGDRSQHHLFAGAVHGADRAVAEALHLLERPVDARVGPLDGSVGPDEVVGDMAPRSFTLIQAT